MKKRWASFRKLLRPFAGPVILLIVLAVLQAALQVEFSLLTKHVIDSAVSRDGELLKWGLILGAVVALMLLSHAAQNWFSGSAADKCSARLRHQLLSAAAYSEDTRLDQFHSGELLSRGMDDVNTVCDGMANTLPTLISQLTRLVGSFLAVMVLCPSLGPILLVVGAVVAIFAGLMRPIMKRRHKEVRKTEDQVMAAMQEDLQQLTLIKSLQAEDQILSRFQNRLVKSLKAKARRRRWSVSAGMMIATASLAGSGALLLWGATRVASGAMTYGSLSAMLQLLSLFRGPVVGLSGQLTKLSGAEVAAERLVEMIGSADRKKPSGLQAVTVEAVVFEDVTFSYPNDEAPVVSNFSIQLPLNDWTCLTGISGKGKTTLFKLMLGLYTPQKGRVYLKTDMGQIPCGAESRHLFAYVPQDFALFSGTIRENLRLVAPDADEQTRKQALHIADADFVWELTNQEKTQVRENNAGLSKGQLQRLAIARAVLMERPILLLDECTSALDAQTESVVLENLRALGKKAILVTHRPKAVAQLDKVSFVEMEE